MMQRRSTWLGRRWLVVIVLLGLGLLYQPEPTSSQPAQTISPAQWHALGQTVATSLTQAGVPPVYVPALTQEYLAAFQHALQQGATAAQADTFASHHTMAMMQQLSTSPGQGQAPSGPPGSGPYTSPGQGWATPPPGGWATAPTVPPASSRNGEYDWNKEFQQNEQRRNQINNILKMR